MINHIENVTCESAKSYLFFHINGDPDKLIPIEIEDHILNCPRCQAEVYLIKGAFSPPRDRMNKKDLIADTMKLHCAYIGKPITCGMIKPFLPSLLVPGLEINIPTPMTVHIEHCPSCSQDFNALKKMDLTLPQLSRVAQLYAKISQVDPNFCQELNQVASSVARMNMREVPSALLQLLCLYPNCRDALYVERQKLLDAAQAASVKDEYPCENVTPRMLFDYVIPYGLMPAMDESHDFGESLRSHARNCPACLTRMQLLHQTIYSIAKSDSGIATTFNVDESSPKPAIRSESEDPYLGWPTRVSVVQKDTKDKKYSIRQKPSERIATPVRIAGQYRLKWFIGSAASAAVVFLIFSIFVNPSPAQGVSLKELYKSLTQINNVYIARYEPQGKAPVQELWYSKTQKMRLYNYSNKSVLWDLPKGITKTRLNNSTDTSTATITKEDLPVMTKIIEHVVGVFPFDNFLDVPSDVAWKQIKNEQVNFLLPDTEVYELAWTEKTQGEKPFCNKWLCYIDPSTKMIRRTEFYNKENNINEYSLNYVKTLNYISDEELQTVLKKAFD